jgi:acetyl esterase/lipase
MMSKDKPSRIIGMLTVLLFLVSCNPTQSTDSNLIATTDPTLPVKPDSTATFLPKTETNPKSTPTKSPTTQPKTEVFRDIPYTNQLKLDVYHPSDSGPWPVVVALHGGGQTKELFNVFSKRIAQLGAVVFTPTYRSSEPQGEQITRDIIAAGWEDAACALRFARAKAADYGGDPTKVVVVGYSGGGTAGAVMALAGDDFEGDCLVSGYSAFPDTFVGVDGAYDLVNCCIPDDLYAKGSPEDWDLLVPYTYIDRQPIREETRFYLIVGGTTELVEMAKTFNERLGIEGYETTLTQFPELDHGQIVSLELPELFGVIEAALYP